MKTSSLVINVCVTCLVQQWNYVTFVIKWDQSESEAWLFEKLKCEQKHIFVDRCGKPDFQLVVFPVCGAQVCVVRVGVCVCVFSLSVLR